MFSLFLSCFAISGCLLWRPVRCLECFVAHCLGILLIHDVNSTKIVSLVKRLLRLTDCDQEPIHGDSWRLYSNNLLQPQVSFVWPLLLKPYYGRTGNHKNTASVGINLFISSNKPNRRRPPAKNAGIHSKAIRRSH